MTLQPADILYIEDTDEYLLLVERREMEHSDTDRTDLVWDMVDIVNGNKYWEWEFVLEGSGQYVRVA